MQRVVSRPVEFALVAPQPGFEPQGETARSVGYTIQVRRDVPSLLPYAVAFVLLVLPPVVLTFRKWSFEHRRMQESDHAPGDDSDSDDDDE